MSSTSKNRLLASEPAGSDAGRELAALGAACAAASDKPATPAGSDAGRELAPLAAAPAAASDNPAAPASGRRILIFTGGTLGEWALAEVQPGDTLIGADRGALFLVRHGLTPDLALGDFDSVSPDELADIRAASRRFEDCDPVLKDWTDTEMAFVRALEGRPEPPQEIVLLGALGSRFDHSLANVHLLRKGLERGISCRIVDGHNEVRLVDHSASATLHRGAYANVSLLPLTLEVRGITLLGFQYPLHNATLTIGQSLGISNVLLEPTGVVTVEEGLLLVIQSRD
jgi:thiamine pyrophosphokinase